MNNKSQLRRSARCTQYMGIRGQGPTVEIRSLDRLEDRPRRRPLGTRRCPGRCCGRCSSASSTPRSTRPLGRTAAHTGLDPPSPPLPPLSERPSGPAGPLACRRRLFRTPLLCSPAPPSPSPPLRCPAGGARGSVPLTNSVFLCEEARLRARLAAQPTGRPSVPPPPPARPGAHFGPRDRSHPGSGSWDAVVGPCKGGVPRCQPKSVAERGPFVPINGPSALSPRLSRAPRPPWASCVLPRLTELRLSPGGPPPRPSAFNLREPIRSATVRRSGALPHRQGLYGQRRPRHRGRGQAVSGGGEGGADPLAQPQRRLPRALPVCPGKPNKQMLLF